MNIALDAVDALDFTKDGDQPVEKVYEFAKEIGMAAPNAEGVEVWGPAPAPIGVVRGRYRWRFLVRSELNVDLSAYMAAWRAGIKLPAQARLQVDVDPYSFL